MSRLELLYICVANLVKAMRKSQDDAFPESLIHYTEEDDHNRVLYHNRSEDTESKITQVLKDAATIITACGSRYDESSEYQLLIRVIEEQTDKDSDGKLTLKAKKSGMNSEILQNPADPDATYMEKAGKENRGYIANVVEAADKSSSIAVDYQFEKNTYSDSQFVKDYLDKQPVSEEGTVLVTDGGYENVKQAEDKNIRLITTDLKGAEVADIYADFKFSDDGKQIISCPAGYKPKSNVYDINTQKCKASFPIEQCKGCPNFSKCNPRLHVRVATIKLARRTSYHAEQQRFFETEKFKEYARFRNGVETIPAALRNRHNVDKMPVRGLIRCRLYFGFKVAAMSVRKLVKYMSSLDKCTPKAIIA